ncbi:unnamed protein product, partial [Trichogramma brassicae]
MRDATDVRLYIVSDRVADIPKAPISTSAFAVHKPVDFSSIICEREKISQLYRARRLVQSNQVQYTKDSLWICRRRSRLLLHVPAAASPELISRSRKWTRRNNFLAGRVFSCTYSFANQRETTIRTFVIIFIDLWRVGVARCSGVFDLVPGCSKNQWRSLLAGYLVLIDARSSSIARSSQSISLLNGLIYRARLQNMSNTFGGGGGGGGGIGNDSSLGKLLYTLVQVRPCVFFGTSSTFLKSHPVYYHGCTTVNLQRPMQRIALHDTYSLRNPLYTCSCGSSGQLVPLVTNVHPHTSRNSYTVVQITVCVLCCILNINISKFVADTTRRKIREIKIENARVCIGTHNNGSGLVCPTIYPARAMC